MSDFVEPYHDRVRASLQAQLAPAERKDLHGRLALALEHTGDAEPEDLARHWEGAGQLDRAAGYAITAGDKAAAKYAFNRAAQLYATALAVTSHDATGAASLGTKLGDVLTCAGRGPEAAEAYLAVANAPTTDASTSLELRRRAAQQLLTAGVFDRGLGEMGRVLAGVGLKLPKTSIEALASMLLRRAQVRLRGVSFDRRREDQVSSEQLGRIDLCWSGVVGLGIVDIIRGADFQSRHLLLALNTGEPNRVCRALGAEAVFSGTEGARSKARSRKLLDAAAQLAQELGNPPALVALNAGTEGAIAHLEGRFVDVPALMDRAEAMLGTHWAESTHFEHDSMRVLRMGSLTWLGRYREYHDRMPRLLEEALERRLLYVSTYIRTGIHAQCYLARGDVDGARQRAEEAIRSWSTTHTSVPHLLDVIARVHLGIYTEDFSGAHACMKSGWKRVNKAFLLRCEYLRINMLETRARAALAWASSAGPRTDHRARYLREAERDADRLEGEVSAWSRPLAALVRGGALFARGNRDESARWLSIAARGFDVLGMDLHAAVARRHLGGILAGDEGRALLARADAIFARETVTDSEGYARLIAPGFDG